MKRVLLAVIMMSSVVASATAYAGYECIPGDDGCSSTEPAGHAAFRVAQLLVWLAQKVVQGSPFAG